MKAITISVFIAASMSFMSPAIARTSVPIVNYENVIVATNSGNTLQAEQVKTAVLVAAGSKGWSVAHQADGKMLASLTVRGKHTIVVEISYTASSYSLHYRDSVNMHYQPDHQLNLTRSQNSYNQVQSQGQGQAQAQTQSGIDSRAVIHPNYNKWVQDLRDAIRIQLLRL